MPELAGSIYTFPAPATLSSSEVREVLSHVDILFTTRLYMGIAAISVKTPALVLGGFPRGVGGVLGVLVSSLGPCVVTLKLSNVCFTVFLI